jgi:hypothetical protein
MSTARGPMGIGREPLTVTLAPHTIKRLTALSSRVRLSRGRLLDLALEGLDVCEDCQGEGLESDGMTRCGTCQGNRLVGVV